MKAILARYLGSFTIMLMLLAAASFAVADEQAPADPTADPGIDGAAPADDGTTDAPTYSNAAQAMHAAQLASAASMQPNPATEQAAEDLDAAREAYDEACKNALANPDDIQLQEQMQQREQDLEQARERYAEQVGELAGVLGQEVQAMRQSGMGWGQIAHELGVHPGTLGLGHGKKNGQIDPADTDPDADLGLENPDDEVAEATKRNTRNGWDQGHGLSASTPGSSKKGLGLSETSSSSASSNKGGGKDKGSSSNSSASQGRSSDGSPGNSGNSQGNSGKDKKDKSEKSNNGNGKGNNK